MHTNAMSGRRRTGTALGIALIALALHSACSTEVNGASVTEFYSKLLERVMAYTPELPQHILDQGIGYQGSTARMEKFIWKLMHGEGVRIALLGGSMTIRGAKQIDQTFIKQVHKWMEVTFVPGCEDEASAEADEQDVIMNEIRSQQAKIWHSSPNPSPPPALNQYEALHVRHSPWYLNHSHICNGSNIELLHLSVPAAGPDYSESCVLQHVPQDVDLVIMEFSCNDYMDPGLFRSSERMSYERMIRHNLGLKGKPAILLIESYCWKQSEYTFDAKLQAAEDKHTLIAKYYGNVQVLSARSVVYDFLEGARADYPRGIIYMSDTMHLAERGHRWYSDIFINYIRHMILRLATRALAVELGGLHNLLSSHNLKHRPRQDRRLLKRRIRNAAPAFSPILRRHLESATDFVARQLLSELSVAYDETDGKCLIGSVQAGFRGIGQAADVQMQYKLNCSGVLSDVILKKPLFEGNEAGSAPGQCSVGPDFANVVKSSVGWDWVDEPAKNGYASTQVGAELVMHLNIMVEPDVSDGIEELLIKTESLGRSSKLPPNVLVAGLIYLLGYQENMGMAEVSCSGLCLCKRSKVCGLAVKQRIKASTPQLHNFYVLADRSKAGSNEVCKITVRNIGDPDKKEASYFKVMGITTSEHHIFHALEIFTKDQTSYGIADP